MFSTGMFIMAGLVLTGPALVAIVACTALITKGMLVWAIVAGLVGIIAESLWMWMVTKS